jgi:hypothetical protein
MTTQTALWDAEAVRRRKMHHAADDSAPLGATFLIANPRLTFDLSCTKHRLLKISNRERIAIFCSLKGERQRGLVFMGEVTLAGSILGHADICMTQNVPLQPASERPHAAYACNAW